MSPTKKKPRLMSDVITTEKGAATVDTNMKHRKSDINGSQSDVQALKRINFVKACEKVSFDAYLNYSERLQVTYLPDCLNTNICKHQNSKAEANIKEVPSRIEQSFNYEMKSNMWSDALEVCRLSINPSQFLSSNMLKDIVEIMMNAHEDSLADYSIVNLISDCQQILALNFSTHPPCLIKRVRNCYNNFLTSPMELKEKTFTNRANFACDKGIIKYCFNRLEYEISAESKDEAFVNRNENIPEEMKANVKGLHWQKENMELFELLKREDRIERIMAVLYSIVELLQFDLAIWHSRYTNNLGCHIMRSHKPLLVYVLWSNNLLEIGAVNNNCRQIFKLFIYLIHLKYPEEYVKTLKLWFNVVSQVFYIHETNSNSDYPNTGKYCKVFVDEFYKILSGVPHDSKIKVLEAIKPTFMRHLVGVLHINSILATKEDDIITIFIDILNYSKWATFPKSDKKITIDKNLNIENVRKNKFLKFLSNKCKEIRTQEKSSFSVNNRLIPCKINSVVDQNHLIHVLFVTFQAYLDAYSVQNVQETLDVLNSQLDSVLQSECVIGASYSVTESFIKKYRCIYQQLKELIMLINKLRSAGRLPDIFRGFENISLLS